MNEVIKLVIAIFEIILGTNNCILFPILLNHVVSSGSEK